MMSTRKANGVLPVSSILATNDAPKTKAKEPARGKKVIVRRLPPGITEAEFWAILGDEWKSGKGKVDWTKFQDGQVSQDPSNPSNPARCYLQVLRTDDIPVLAEVVQRSIWEDEKRTFNDPALVGPPYLELSIYQKIPTTKRRTDSKQGTIDQDPDFMAFLDSLTQDPAVKEVEAEQVADDSPKESVKVTTTPLVEYLKEKKANKGKETTNTKSGKHGRHESQGGKTKGSQEDSKKKGKESKGEKAEKASEKDEKKAKEPVKLLTKKAAAQEAAEAAKSTPASTTASKTTEEAVPKSRRANIAAAAKILQRDLGLSPGSAHRRARQDAAKAEAAAKVDSGKEKDSKDTVSTTPTTSTQPASSAPPSAPTAPKAQAAEGSRRSRGAKAAKQNTSSDTAKGKEGAGSTTKSTPVTTPVILKRRDDNPPTGPASTAPATTASATPTPPTGPKAATGKASTSKSGPSQKKGSGQPSITAGATRAFVKHANPSQGVTEPLLKQAMEIYGPVTFVEIDKRKGFAYVDFGDHDALVKAITASPVSVAQGTVQVLERKEIKKPTQAPTQPAAEKASSDAPPDRPKRGGRGRGRRGGGNANNANTNAASEASSSTTPVHAVVTDSKDSNAAAPTG
ncbi:Smg-4/UPF3 family-domain-containing protein [Annulohypoxylon maeteangense]|uniref:Smg-4/UPF3 family-domain-containing protein n=1 Tax=Annulohypoxylon maeteangense TaxID=1927788 RepID=UPI002008B597|nr:Smg-4/UPF3 family-domain-containing protein [Annulohypoxylon maeteangense]KAI0884923.1 Smg-4/UPF3 family-domain-containing protein [Annulohypoxylon maeteangense]